ncbi:hypothetical protein GS636_10240 [Ruegeria sp. HKCCD4884]|uniref:substrate binding domain-containing protein n=1 Tax=Ruegeria sp. HKCCD4884 TaxID=2683022 RepID=UPI001491694F|nr:substrate binding domain-containing protein [Ruegeria sp. HKCCD4884]NOD93165.1 hypothetical protein [Ruegeria sp. HKCCD4884]
MGRLRISAPTILASQKFAGFLRQYREENPGVAIEIDLSDDLRDAIDEQYDLIVRIAGLSALIKGADLLFPTAGIICAGPDDRREISTPEDLAQMCWIKTPTMGQTLTLSEANGRGNITVTPRYNMVVNSGQLVRALVDQGVGFAIFPDFVIADALAEGQIFNVFPEWSAGERGVFAIHSARNAKLSIATGFVEGWKAYIAQTCS